ncbi:MULTISPECIES: M28 family metallopeptidase [Methanoculleus]|jgi:hypothetical protein|uniref:Peptidase family M28 n=1 Tax=Methanoculleus thermophilus TaxID=2200 RepID=A0A1G8WR90_9EURY|nr:MULTISPECIES: M28 family metallopeptidase [Methanoculleus]SDJ80120.1 Peptidase family M28 [Methanoculleus thermophilus]
MPSRSCLQVAFLAAYGIVFILAPAAAAPSDAPGYDPGIAALLDEVDGSEIRKTAYDLQNFSTRAYGSDGNREAGEYIYQRLSAIPGLEVEFQGGEVHNVIARLPGTNASSAEIVVVGAHYDSRSSDPARAPGVTDNGCGVAVVLELARVMSGHSFDRTVEFAFWNAEENGRHGSRRYVENPPAPIALYLNYDSTCRGEGDRPRLNLLYDQGARSAAELVVHHNTLYGTNFTLTRSAAPFISDHISFWSRGYPALMAHALPQWPAHTPDDTIDQASFEFAERNARLGLSVLARVARMEGLVSPPPEGGSDPGVSWPMMPNWGANNRAEGNRCSLTSLQLSINPTELCGCS